MRGDYLVAMPFDAYINFRCLKADALAALKPSGKSLGIFITYSLPPFPVFANKFNASPTIKKVVMLYDLPCVNLNHNFINYVILLNLLKKNSVFPKINREKDTSL